MSKAVYNVSKLIAIDGMDAISAMKNFSDSQAYFEKLDEFLHDAHYFLQGYNPIMAIHSPNVRSEFLNDINIIRNNTSMLEMSVLLSTIINLEYAVEISSTDTLSDWLKQFHVQMDSMSRSIALAR